METAVFGCVIGLVMALFAREVNRENERLRLEAAANLARGSMYYPYQ